MKDFTESTQGDDWTRESLYSLDDVSTAGALQWYRWPDGTMRRDEYNGVSTAIPAYKVVDGSAKGGKGMRDFTGQATLADTLLKEIMDPGFAKNEREWFAGRYIEALTAECDLLRRAIETHRRNVWGDGCEVGHYEDEQLYAALQGEER